MITAIQSWGGKGKKANRKKMKTAAKSIRYSREMPGVLFVSLCHSLFPFFSHSPSVSLCFRSSVSVCPSLCSCISLHPSLPPPSLSFPGLLCPPVFLSSFVFLRLCLCFFFFFVCLFLFRRPFLSLSVCLSHSLCLFPCLSVSPLTLPRPPPPPPLSLSRSVCL